MKNLKITIGLIFFSMSAWGAPSLSTKIHSPYSSIRALGMGNAFTAVADDYSLIMYNPAGFARKKHNEIQFTLAGAGVSPKTLNIAKDIQTAADTQGTDAQKAQAVSDVLDKYYGTILGGKVQALELFWVRNGWGIALLPADLTIDIQINKQLGPALDLNIKGDTTLAFGFGTDLTETLDAGITAKYVHRISVEEIVPALELATNPSVLSDKRFREGTAFDFDLGFMWTPKWGGSSKSEEKSEPAPEAVSTPPESTAPAVEQEVKVEEAVASPEKTAEPVADKKQEQATNPAADQPADERAPQSEEATASTAAPAVTTDSTAPAQTAPAVSDTNAAAITAVTDNKTAEPAVEAPPAEVKPAETATESAPKEEKVVETETTEEAEEDSIPRLSFGFVVHNVIGGEFKLSKMVNKNATEVPTKMHRVIDVGSQYKLYAGEDFTIRTMLDFKNILHPEINFNKSFHAGLEFDYSPNTWFKTQLRGGVSQMYYTAGASFLFGVFNIDVATYGEEVGTKSTRLENRVYAAKLGFNF